MFYNEKEPDIPTTTECTLRTKNYLTQRLTDMNLRVMVDKIIEFNNTHLTKLMIPCDAIITLL